jgi:hypothetical protein
VSTFTEIVAVVVMHSSSAALSHFGVAIEPVQIEKAPPAAQRVIARSHRKPDKVSAQACPAAAHVSKA